MWLVKRRSAPVAVAVAVAAIVVLAGCSGSPHSVATSGRVFPSTPAGVQARWFFQAAGTPPIADAAIRAHFDTAFLAKMPPPAINAVLAGAGQLGLVSVSSARPDAVEFVMSVRAEQRFRVDLTVDARGLISGLKTPELPSAASPASVIPALAPGWVAQPVTFEAGGVTVHGTFTHPGSAPAGTLPAALLIAGYGSSTDRNDNAPGQPARNTLEAVANWLSTDGVASLRYDKLGSGQTGWGPYAADPGRAGLGTYEQETVAALNFLAGQQQVDRARLAVFGHSEGAIYSLLLASGLAGHAPEVHAVGLLEPIAVRFLDQAEQDSIASLTHEVQNGQVTAAAARSAQRAIAQAIVTTRRTGTVPALLVNSFQPPVAEAVQIDRYDPAAVAAKLPAHTAVLLTCSNADDKFGCAQIDHLVAGLSQASARLDYVHLDGVDHFLKEDISKNIADYDESLPFSAQLRAALQAFVASNL